MCQFKSAICLKDRVFVPGYDSHSAMLQELGIPDDMRHATETFVRVECSPADGDKTSDPMGWQIKVDQDILPDWFMPEIDYPRIKEAVKMWCDVHVLRNGNHTVKDGVWIATGSATVKAFDSATVEASDSATVVASGSATVEASGSATVEAFDSATVKAFDSATVKAYDSATVRAFDSATVKAYGSATVKAFDATVEAYGSATVKAFDSATVILPARWQTNKAVTLAGNAICVNHADHTIRSVIKWTQVD